MWACARGHLEATVILYQLNPNALRIVNRKGLLPYSIAQMCGHLHVINELSRLEGTSQQLTSGQAHHPLDANQATSTPPSAPIFVTSLHSLSANLSTTTTTSQSQVTISTPATMTTVFTPVSQTTPQAISPTQWATPAPMEDLTIQIPQQAAYVEHKSTRHYDSLPPSLQATPVYSSLNHGSAEQRRARLMKRTSVEVLPDYPVAGFVDIPKSAKTNTPDNIDTSSHVEEGAVVQDQSACHLRASNSDPHLCGLDLSRGPVADPMISMSNRDLNSPIMFMQTDSLHPDTSLTLEDLHNDIAMETDSRSPSPLCDVDEDTLREASMSQCGGNELITLL